MCLGVSCNPSRGGLNTMSVSNKLRSALSAIDDAKRAIERARQLAPSEANADLQRAVRELDDAETYIQRAKSEAGHMA